jgi:hypothetical protein
VDFSGAADAGRRIWIAEGEPSSRGLHILSCQPAEELPGGARERGPALSALVQFITEQGNAIFGCDFPFALPREIARAKTWDSFIAGFDHVDAPAFRDSYRRVSPGCEPKRQTDRDARTPWCAFNLRLYHQTYWGLAGLLRPLVGKGAAAVLPMQEPVAGRAWMIETCPASVLKNLAWRGSYKQAALGDQRRAILQLLQSKGHLAYLAGKLADRILADAGGDALDSVIAVLATARALSDIAADRGSGDRIEGRVYFAL